ncbi:hypothetical protein NKG94_05605 [Micromonospora sp. M12]
MAQADDMVAACLDAATWALPEHELIAALDAAHRLEQRLAAVKLTVVRELDGRGTATAQGASPPRSGSANDFTSPSRRPPAGRARRRTGQRQPRRPAGTR